VEVVVVLHSDEVKAVETSFKFAFLPDLFGFPSARRPQRRATSPNSKEFLSKQTLESEAILSCSSGWCSGGAIQMACRGRVIA
ncbi:hypothetical protein, partial [Alcaligenes faecalis]|uniref:hypothetical protein n=1 Tax=Alcaligenes faecalis TaxID=511 RepID=UPI0034D6A0EE